MLLVIYYQVFDIILKNNMFKVKVYLIKVIYHKNCNLEGFTMIGEGLKVLQNIKVLIHVCRKIIMRILAKA